MKRISFKVDNVTYLPRRRNFIKMSFKQRLKYDVSFTIIINNEVYFHDPYFPIFDFMHYIEKWLHASETTDMEYDCIETEDNPLIVFFNRDQKWYVYSPWEEFNCKDGFLLEELIEALQNLKKSFQYR